MQTRHYTEIHADLISPLAKAFLVCVIAFGLCSFFVGRTGATFVASATIDGNSVTTAVIPPPPFVPGPGDVVVNEIMWMGSGVSSADEWIELRNTTGQTIDLSGWKVDGLGSGTTTVAIPSGTLAPNGFFLISHFVANASAMSDAVTVDQVTPGVSLVNTGEQLMLKNASDVVIDQTPTGGWAAGTNAPMKKSMERNSVPGDGTLAGSWHTCVDLGCNDTTYWDVEGTNYGTPRAANLSINDPTAEDFIEFPPEEAVPQEVAPEEIFVPDDEMNEGEAVATSTLEGDENGVDDEGDDQNGVGEEGDGGSGSDGVGAERDDSDEAEEGTDGENQDVEGSESPEAAEDDTDEDESSGNEEQGTEADAEENTEQDVAENTDDDSDASSQSDSGGSDGDSANGGGDSGAGGSGDEGGSTGGDDSGSGGGSGDGASGGGGGGDSGGASSGGGGE